MNAIELKSISNFPFPEFRENQIRVINDIDAAFGSGYRYIILEAPVGFGKSPVAIAVARTLGTSYICTSTKDLQTQYARDFPFLKVADSSSTASVKSLDIRELISMRFLCNHTVLNGESSLWVESYLLRIHDFQHMPYRKRLLSYSVHRDRWYIYWSLLLSYTHDR